MAQSRGIPGNEDRSHRRILTGRSRTPPTSFTVAELATRVLRSLVTSTKDHVLDNVGTASKPGRHVSIATLARNGQPPRKVGRRFPMLVASGTWLAVSRWCQYLPQPGFFEDVSADSNLRRQSAIVKLVGGVRERPVKIFRPRSDPYLRSRRIAADINRMRPPRNCRVVRERPKALAQSRGIRGKAYIS